MSLDDACKQIEEILRVSKCVVFESFHGCCPGDINAGWIALRDKSTNASTVVIFSPEGDMRQVLRYPESPEGVVGKPVQLYPSLLSEL